MSEETKFTLTRQGSKHDYYYKEFTVDTEADLLAIDTSSCCAGSNAIVLNGGDVKVKVLNNKKEWVEI